MKAILVYDYWSLNCFVYDFGHFWIVVIKSSSQDFAAQVVILGRIREGQSCNSRRNALTLNKSFNSIHMGQEQLHKHSIAEYLQLEYQSDAKNEFDNGVIKAMTGGTLNHGIIGNNINTELNNILSQKNSDCISINNDVKIYIDKANSFVYPDGMIICGEIQTSESDQHAVINPKLVIEVLSKSTESYDRGGKFHKYCSLESFCEYLLIDQYKPVVDTLYRADNKYWKMVTTIGIDKSIYINSLDCSITMERIYRNTQNLASPPFTTNH
ncbi:MAG: Uma2 family endonuclease [Bacteroidota bacterium]